MHCTTDTTDDTTRVLAAAGVNSYEAAVRAVTEFQWMLARGAVCEPLGRVAAAWADLTRDSAAIQLSTARWILDL